MKAVSTKRGTLSQGVTCLSQSVCTHTAVDAEMPRVEIAREKSGSTRKEGKSEGSAGDDASSEIFEGKDLRVTSLSNSFLTCLTSIISQSDLQNALKGDFEFKGSYAYAASSPQAPNPCLNISGLGIIGLPLSER